MSCKLIVKSFETGVVSALFSDDRPVELHFTPKTERVLIGSIYVGRVKDVVKNLQAAFIDLGDGKKGYYPIDEKHKPIYTKKGASTKIQQGDELLVQIKKEAVKSKEPVLTTDITLTSVYFVAMLGNTNITCSNKIPMEKREHLRGWVKERVSDIGIIIRTNAAEAEKEELEKDLNRLCKRIRDIRDRAVFRPAGTQMYQGIPEYLTVIKNMNQSMETEILTDDEELYQELSSYLSLEMPNMTEYLSFYKDRLLPLDKLYSVERAIEESFQEKVWLKSGGYLVIQETEALTVVDVNTGKCAVKKEPQETFFKVNLEAARETARQLRLRNISGIIIVDFINLEEKEKKQKLLEVMDQYLKQDPVAARVVDLTALGLVEITRRRMKGTIKEQMGKNLSCFLT